MSLKRLHTSYNQTITITGRLSSSSPNHKTSLYELMMVKRLDQHLYQEKDINYFSADYSQIELRIMAHHQVILP